jgi:7-cyano-7-deazaguanine reductase
MKHLKAKKEFNFKAPDWKILDTFLKPPYVKYVYLEVSEVTSLCPLTHQPDYHTVKINYTPEKVCVESKSLKLYLGSFRMYGTFTETLSAMIAKDLCNILKVKVEVEVESASRGGIKIHSTAYA